MHRKLEAELLPLDTELEITLKNLRKATSTGDRSMDNKIKKIADYSKRRRSRETT